MIADLLIDLVAIHPGIKHLAAGVMRDVLVIRDLEAMSSRLIKDEHDAAVAVIREEIDDIRTQIDFLSLGGDYD